MTSGRMLKMGSLPATLTGILAWWVHPQTEVLNEGDSTLRLFAGDLAQTLKQKSNRLKAQFYNTKSGTLNYAAAAASPEFADYINTSRLLRNFDPVTLKTREEKLAFWINLYNALTIHGIIVYRPEKSVWDVKSFFDRAAYNVGGYRFSLNDIEHGILRANRPVPPLFRKRFAERDPRCAYALSNRDFDPRIHFALNCGSKSCPPIAFYDPDMIDRQLEMATKAFVRSETKVSGDKLLTSSLFKWYRSDFGNDVAAFIVGYLDKGSAKSPRLVGGQVRVAFKPYDWSLNAE